MEEKNLEGHIYPKIAVTGDILYPSETHIVKFQTYLFQMPIEEITVFFQESYKTLSKKISNQWLCLKMQFHLN